MDIDRKTGITGPGGFEAAGVACGLKKNGDADLALVVCAQGTTCAGIFTTNVVKGHSLQLCRQHAAGGLARAVLINAGNANACVGPQGLEDARTLCRWSAQKLGCPPEQVLPGSTGVIGVPLPMEKLRGGLDEAFAALSEGGGDSAARAIMTTDTRDKQGFATVACEGGYVGIGAMAKGSGMIHPLMATMIVVLTTDARVSPQDLDAALRRATAKTLNRISIDGDMSVCDKALLLASGASGVTLCAGTEDYEAFVCALTGLCRDLARRLAADGEGATKLLTVEVRGAATDEDAHRIADAIALSPLCKTAAFGRDANWGRILTAAGYAGVAFDPEKADVSISGLPVCRAGAALAFDEEAALALLGQEEVVYTLDLHGGPGRDTMWTCDFSYDYVKINGSYRT